MQCSTQGLRCIEVQSIDGTQYDSMGRCLHYNYRRRKSQLHRSHSIGLRIHVQYARELASPFYTHRRSYDILSSATGSLKLHNSNQCPNCMCSSSEIVLSNCNYFHCRFCIHFLRVDTFALLPPRDRQDNLVSLCHLRRTEKEVRVAILLGLLYVLTRIIKSVTSHLVQFDIGTTLLGHRNIRTNVAVRIDFRVTGYTKLFFDLIVVTIHAGIARITKGRIVPTRQLKISALRRASSNSAIVFEMRRTGVDVVPAYRRWYIIIRQQTIWIRHRVARQASLISQLTVTVVTLASLTKLTLAAAICSFFWN